MLFVAGMGILAYLQTDQLHRQNELLYNHPLQVRRALGNLKSDIYKIHWALETAFRCNQYSEMVPFLEIIATHEASADKNFGILYRQYLGPKEDIDSLHSSYVYCKYNREEVLAMMRVGNIALADEINIHKGVVLDGPHLTEINQKLEKISNFATAKAESIQKESHTLNSRLNQQLTGLLLLVLLLSLLINYRLYHNIKRPLEKLTSATRMLEQGHYHVRSPIDSKNEFGVLSKAFNELADKIPRNERLNSMTNKLAGIMLGEDEIRRYFESTLNLLAELTRSQMIAVYIRTQDELQYKLYYSLGLDENAPRIFSASGLEGEFGTALSSGEIQIVRLPKSHDRYVFHAVSGDIIPTSLLTLPVIAGRDIIAMISMASVEGYPEEITDWLRQVQSLISARIAGILTYQRVKEFTLMLEDQNKVLEAQRGELESQAGELKVQNVELEKQKRQLDEANRLKTHFLSNMSHEIRTPLNSVIALSGVLSRRLQNRIGEEELSYLNVVERNGKHLLALINDILDISRIESGREVVETSQFNLCDLVNEVIHLIHPQAEAKGLTMDKVSGDCSSVMISDAAKIRHILQNLIGNAVKFTEKGQIRTNILSSGSMIEIVVTDTGIGIDEAHLPHIFDEFRQADSSTSRKYGGTGLGLAIARKYAHMLGGSIEVKSSPGSGSEFRLRLPLSIQDGIVQVSSVYEKFSLPSDGPENNAFSSTSAGKNVLLVEDSEAAIVQIKDVLEPEGFEIWVAENGEIALERIHKNIPDAIILDLMMPGIDGFELLIRLRSMEGTRHLPVLILSAKHITPEELKVLKNNNVFQLIQKGDVNREELLSTVRRMLRIGTKDSPLSIRARNVVSRPRPLVLVVEDNEDNYLTVEALLKEDYNVAAAADGHEAVERARILVPDLILMDIALPGMDGIKAFYEIRKLPSLQFVPIIALTASAMTTERETILAHGFDAYIPKPIDADEFFKTLKAILYGERKD